MQPVATAAITSLIVIYVTGAYLTESLHSRAYDRPRLAVLEIVLFALLGAMTGRRMRAIRRHSADEQMNPSEWNALTCSPFLKVSVSTRIWIVMGTILLTAAKPNLRGLSPHRCLFADFRSTVPVRFLWATFGGFDG